MSIQLPLPFPPEEIWKDIPGYEGLYQASNEGRLRRLICPRPGYPAYSIVMINIAPNGYARVRLARSDTRKYIYCHRLVMLAFRGECLDGMQVNHIDGDKTNSYLNNLEYVTPKQNIAHAQSILGTHQGKHGTDVKMAILDDDKVRAIRQLARQGTMQRQIARMYGVCEANISMIVHRKTWKHVD